jgi:chloride channel protein, CIC family
LSWLHKLNAYFKRSTNVYMVLVATVIGLVGGLGAVGFRLLILEFQTGIWQPEGAISDSGGLLDWIRDLPWWWVVGAPALGGLLVGWMVNRYAKEARGHGVPEVMEAVALRHGRIRPRVVGIKALASSLCIASGGSVGREGPIVQIGSAIGSTLGQWLNVSPRRLRTLVGCGAASGIAATFNAPVAGALFAVEVILGDFGVPQFSPIVIASVVATVVSRHFLGDLPAFEIPQYSLAHPGELVAYAILGMLAGLVAIAFTQSLHLSEELFEKIRLHAALKAGLGGAAVGCIALMYPEVLGVGYEAMNNALSGSPGFALLAGLLLAKIVAVSLTIGTGGSGGVFAPSLFLGASLGGAVGVFMRDNFPGSAPPGAYALVGMGAVVSAATHAPITAIMILFELTTDYQIILPLMISCIIGTLVMSRLHSDSIYTIKLRRRGVNIRSGQDVDLLRSVPVRDVVRENLSTVLRHDPFLPILQKLYYGSEGAIYVIDEQQELIGVITLSQLRPVLEDISTVQNMLVAEDVATLEVPVVQADENLDAVLQRLDQTYRDELPVLENGHFLGAVHMSDVLDRYRREVFKHQMTDGIASSMPAQSEETVVHRVGAFVLAEIDAPVDMFGQTLIEMDFRCKYHVNVLLVRPNSTEVIEPHPPATDYRFSPGDRLVVFGSAAAVEGLRSV